MLEIKKYNRKDLEQYVNSQTFKDLRVIPISFHRAISQCNNPRALEDDILLFVAYEDDQIAGYLGALPDDYFTKDNAKVHLAWMSCLWVNPAHRGKKIAQKLIQSCFEAWEHRIILTEFTTEAGSLYQKINLFDPWLTLKGRRWYIQSDLAFILPPKHSIFHKLKPVLKVVDRSLNAIMNIRNFFGDNLKDSFEESTHLSEETISFLNYDHDSSGFQRSADELHWLIQFPWVLEGENEIETQRYHFTSYATQFCCSTIHIKVSNGNISGIMVYTVRNGHLKIPYFTQTCPADLLTKTLLQIVKQNRVKTMTLYSKTLIDYLQKSKSIKSFSKDISRKYLISKTLSPIMPFHESTIYDGDGDCGFT
jgi:GNAT superfamily N-acetyltransferase